MEYHQQSHHLYYITIVSCIVYICCSYSVTSEKCIIIAVIFCDQCQSIPSLTIVSFTLPILIITVLFFFCILNIKKIVSLATRIIFVVVTYSPRDCKHHHNSEKYTCPNQTHCRSLPVTVVRKQQYVKQMGRADETLQNMYNYSLLCQKEYT